MKFSLKTLGESNGARINVERRGKAKVKLEVIE